MYTGEWVNIMRNKISRSNKHKESFSSEFSEFLTHKINLLMSLLTRFEEGPASAGKRMTLEVVLLPLVVTGEATIVAVITGLTLLDTGAVTALLRFIGDNCVLGIALVEEDSLVTRDEVELGVGFGAMGDGLVTSLATDSPTDFIVLTKVSAIPMMEGTCTEGVADNLSEGVVFSGRGVALKPGSVEVGVLEDTPIFLAGGVALTAGSVEDAVGVLEDALIFLAAGLWKKGVCTRRIITCMLVENIQRNV